MPDSSPNVRRIEDRYAEIEERDDRKQRSVPEHRGGDPGQQLLAAVGHAGRPPCNRARHSTSFSATGVASISVRGFRYKDFTVCRVRLLKHIDVIGRANRRLCRDDVWMAFIISQKSKNPRSSQMSSDTSCSPARSALQRRWYAHVRA